MENNKTRSDDKIKEYLKSITIEKNSGLVVPIKYVANVTNLAYQQGIEETLEFTEWVCYNYIRLHNVWVHKLKNQLDKSNYLTTKELYDFWIKRKERLKNG